MPGTDRYQQHRAQAIRAAASVFSEKGFHGATTKDIAERLGIKQGSLYYYFRSKEEALEEVCLFGIRDYVLRMDQIAVSDQPFEAKLMAVLTSHLSSYRERNEALKVHNDERLYLPSEKRTRLKELGTHYREKLEHIFEEGVADGTLRDSLDCHFAAQSVIGICNAWGDIIIREPDLDMFAVIQKCADLLLDGFRERRGADSVAVADSGHG
jgi:TetR/AcrR family transcriptional regulator, cholesterol catabolism regulator